MGGELRSRRRKWDQFDEMDLERMMTRRELPFTTKTTREEMIMALERAQAEDIRHVASDSYMPGAPPVGHVNCSCTIQPVQAADINYEDFSKSLKSRFKALIGKTSKGGLTRDQ